MRRTRKVLFFIVCLILLGIAAEIAVVKFYTSERKQNLIVISIDSLRADRMSLYGYERATTPVIDEWAKDAIVFDNYFAAAYLTPIAEMAVQTGTYPIKNGVINFEASLRGDVLTLAEVLQRNGYQTASVGSSPEFTLHPGLKDGFTRGFDVFNIRKDNFDPRTSSPPMENAVWWLEQVRKPSTPFYLWIHLGSVHWPYGADVAPHFTDPAYDGFLKSIEYDSFPEPYGYLYDGVRYADINGDVVGEVTPADSKYVNDRYDDGLRETDKNLKTLFQYLESSGLGENTVVVLQSEHGESLGDRGYVAHYDLYDEQVHVPLVMRLPRMAARRVQEVISGVDVMPTVLESLGVPSPRVDGKSYIPFLHGSAAPRREIFMTRTPFWERVIRYGLPFGEELEKEDNEKHFYDTAIRTDRWKLIHRIGREAEKKYSWWGHLTGKPVERPEYEFYDLLNDPKETTNRYDEFSSRGDATLADLVQKLTVWEAEMHTVLPGRTPTSTIQEYF